jgi:hypothetical protein
MKPKIKVIKKESSSPVSDTTKKKVVIDKVTEAREARKKLDSVAAVNRAEIIRKKDSISQRVAAAKGMTVAEVREQQKKQKEVKMETRGPSFKSTKCGINKAATKQSKRDWKKM